MWYMCIHTMEYNSAMRQKKILSFVTARTNLEDMLKWKTWRKKTTIQYRLCMESKKVALIETEWSGGCQGLGGGRKWADDGQSVQTSLYKMNKLWGVYCRA